jgi:hypothetical protein
MFFGNKMGFRERMLRAYQAVKEVHASLINAGFYIENSLADSESYRKKNELNKKRFEEDKRLREKIRLTM